MKARVAGIVIGLIVVAAAIGGGLYWRHTNSGAGSKSANSDQVNQPTPGANQLQITDETVGTGAEAQAGHSVTVNYLGTLADGTKFDSSYDRNQPFSFTLGAGQVIQGWDQGVAGMKVGGKRKLVIPPDLAYGADGSPPKIPGNATLTFEIELLSVQ